MRSYCPKSDGEETIGKNLAAASKSYRRFTLRTLMAVIAAWGMLHAWIRWQGGLDGALTVVSHSVIAWALCLITAFAVARFFGPIVRGSAVRATVSGLLAVALLATLYLAWAHHRAMYKFIFGLDQAFPYPDPAINSLERWFDARRPVHPGSFKLHGEYMTVGSVLGKLVLVGVSLSGFLVGALFNRPQGAPPEIGGTSEP